MPLTEGCPQLLAYLEVCGTLEGLPADTAAVDALLAVDFLAVVHQHCS